MKKKNNIVRVKMTTVSDSEEEGEHRQQEAEDCAREDCEKHRLDAWVGEMWN